jgi:hypothetical protein
MKSMIVKYLAAMALLAAAAIPLRLAAQNQQDHYRVINLGNLSGAAS